MASKLEEALKAWQDQYPERPMYQRPDKPRSIYALCPPPIRYGQDQYRCQKCGHVWDVDEPKPPCQDTPTKEGNGHEGQ